MQKSIYALLATLSLLLLISLPLQAQIDEIQKVKLVRDEGYEQKKLTLPFDDQERSFLVKKVGAYYILNGDIVVGDDLKRPMAYQRAIPAIPGIPSSIFLWPNGQLPIEIDRSVYEFGMDATVRQAVAEYNNKVSNLCLVSHTNEKDYVRLVIESDLGSAGGLSAVGRQGGEQLVRIAAGQPASVIIHELMHAIGFWHEQNRPDRDRFISVNMGNVEKGMGGNFQIEWSGIPRSNYDYCSIMHYPATAFGNGKTTISCAQNGNPTNCPPCMGMGTGLSADDIAGINTAYNFAQKLLPCGTALNMEPRWYTLTGKTLSNQEATPYGVGKLAVFAFGTNGDVFCNRWDGSKWTDWTSTGWGNAPTRSQIKAVSWAAGRLDAFVVAGNKNLMHSWWEGGNWSAWENLGGTLTGEFDVISWAKGRIDIVGRDQNGGLSHLFFENTWGKWESIFPKDIKEGSTVELAAWAPLRLDIFAVKNDQSVQHLWFDKAWGPGESLQGTIAGQMAVASFGIGHLDIFGEGGDGSVWHKYYDMTKWSDWHTLGGKVVHNSGLGAVSWGNGRLDLFVRGLDDALYHAWWGGGKTWSPFERLGGKINSSPAVASWGPNRLDVFTRGENSSIQQMFWNGVKWGL